MKKEEIPQFLTFTGKDGKDRIYDFADKDDVQNFLMTFFYEKELEDASLPICTALSIPKDADFPEPDADLNPFELMQQYGSDNKSVTLIKVEKDHDLIYAAKPIGKEYSKGFPCVEGWQDFIPEKYRPRYVHLEEGFYMMMHATQGLLRTPTSTAQQLIGAMLTHDTDTIESIIIEANIIAERCHRSLNEED